MTLEELLLGAVEVGDRHQVLLLLRAGADIDARNGSQATPLIRATVKGDVGVVKLLLEQGANAALKDRDGYTALDRAVYDLKYRNEIEKALRDYWRERWRKEQPIPPERVREFLEAHSHCYHAAFALRDGTTYEGAMSVEEDRDVVLFKEVPGIFSPDAEWDESWFENQEEIPFGYIDMSSLMW
jgi:hypothetical protein